MVELEKQFFWSLIIMSFLVGVVITIGVEIYLLPKIDKWVRRS